MSDEQINSFPNHNFEKSNIFVTLIETAENSFLWLIKYILNDIYKLRVCLPHKHRSSVYRNNAKFDTLHIFCQIGPLRRVNTLARCGNIGEMVFSQKHSDTLPDSGIKPRVDNLAVANLHSN